MKRMTSNFFKFDYLFRDLLTEFSLPKLRIDTGPHIWCFLNFVFILFLSNGVFWSESFTVFLFNYTLWRKTHWTLIIQQQQGCTHRNHWTLIIQEQQGCTHRNHWTLIIQEQQGCTHRNHWTLIIQQQQGCTHRNHWTLIIQQQQGCTHRNFTIFFPFTFPEGSRKVSVEKEDTSVMSNNQ